MWRAEEGRGAGDWLAPGGLSRPRARDELAGETGAVHLLLACFFFSGLAAVSEVSDQTLRGLGLAWVAGNASFYLFAVLALRGYSIRRDDHHRHLEELAQRAAETTRVGGGSD